VAYRQSSDNDGTTKVAFLDLARDRVVKRTAVDKKKRSISITSIAFAGGGVVVVGDVGGSLHAVQSPTPTVSATFVTGCKGSEGTSVLSFTTKNPIAADGKITIEFPSTLHAVAATAATISSGMDGTLAASSNGRTVTMTRQGDGTVTSAGAAVEISIPFVINQKFEGAVTTKESNGKKKTLRDLVFDYEFRQGEDGEKGQHNSSSLPDGTPPQSPNKFCDGAILDLTYMGTYLAFLGMPFSRRPVVDDDLSDDLEKQASMYYLGVKFLFGNYKQVTVTGKIRSKIEDLIDKSTPVDEEEDEGEDHEEERGGSKLEMAMQGSRSRMNSQGRELRRKSKRESLQEVRFG